jgi:hypothetical protein
MPVEGASTAGKAAAAAAEAAGAQGPPPGAGRALSALGGTLFYGAAATAAFFGYYTYSYDVEQLDHMIEETQKGENSFPGSTVRAAAPAAPPPCPPSLAYNALS